MRREVYNEMYENENTHWWWVSQRSILRKILNRYISNTKINILEVGCGTGGNLSMLKDYGNLSAMEPDENARKLANSRNICLVKEGTLPNNIPFDETFDLVCMLGVLEHIDDDFGTLKSVKSKLKEKGVLMLTVPAYKFLWGYHDHVCHHKRRYTKKDLTALLSKSGLNIEYVTYYNTFLFPIIAPIKILKKIFGMENDKEGSVPWFPINNLLTKVFSSEKLVLPTLSLPFGVHILVIATNLKNY
tara:strand:- start:257 stop:991 length:735 start_codon:yes stop_codon:yes gene_type:complete